MTSIAHVSEAIRTILTERATALERPTGFVERRSARLSGAVFAQTLVFGFLTFPQASYAQLQQVAASLGVPVSRQAVQQRFGPASALFMRQLLEEAVAQVKETRWTRARTVLALLPTLPARRHRDYLTPSPRPAVRRRARRSRAVCGCSYV
jgi:hypothetical protein